MYRVLIGILAILVSSTAFAVNAEYKNSLTKIELNKTSDSSYNINLYTSKVYQEPIKVIKKSGTNYYILLPETKNNTKDLTSGNGDIRSIESRLFPYAGADVQNGYTKISINTNKPINFTVNTKATLASNHQTVIVQESKNEEVKTAVGEAKAQKKNLVQETQKSNDTSLKSKEIKTAKKPDVLPQKKIEKPAMAAAKIDLKEKDTKKQEVNEVKKPQKVEQQKQTPKPATAENKLTEAENQPNETQNNPVNEENIQDENMGRDTIEQIVSDQNAIQEADTENEDQNVRQNVEQDDSIPVKMSAFAQFKKGFQEKLAEYGLNMRELILMIFATILSFIVMLLVLTKGRETDTRLKSKADFIDKSQKSSMVAKKGMQKQKPNNQYFVFDNNVKQTGFIPPTSNSDRNYELSSYSPIKEDNSNKIEPYRSKKVTSEYDIIQNILKEDNYIDLSASNPVGQREEAVSYKDEEPHETTQEYKESQEPTPAENNDLPPEVLSSVEIAPQRGFMCVLYNNTISLMGYIFEDVFALYNFKQPKLENYAIKFRLSEKTANGGANFLVRVGKSKMLINVTKSSMNLEVAM